MNFINNPPTPILIESYSLSGYILEVTFQDYHFDKENMPKLLALDPKLEVSFYIDFTVLSDNRFSVNFESVKDHLEFNVRKNFQLHFEQVTNNETELCPLKETRTIGPAEERYQISEEGLWLTSEKEPDPVEHLSGIYTNRRKIICFSLFTRRSFIAYTRKCNVQSVKIKNNLLKIKMEVAPGEYEFEKVVLTYRNKLAEDAAAYDFTVTKQRTKGEFLQLKLELDLSSIEWKSIYWDVFIYLRHTQTDCLYRIKGKFSTFKRMFYKLLYNGSFPGENDFFLYPYYTGKRELAFAYRQRNKYDGMDIVFKEAAAMVICKLFRPFLKRKHILLVCEKFSEMAQDNGYYFFKHCMENNEEQNLNKKIYYIITKDSPDRKRLEPYSDHLLDFMSLKHLCYLMTAELIVSSDSRYHTYPLQSRHSVFNRFIKKIPFVFLQHGVIALKRVDSFYGKNKTGGCNLFVVSNEFEKSIIVNEFKYEPEEVINTGLPRWDVLQDKSEGKRDILIMPTWRNWLDSVSDEEFEQSDYFTHYMGLLNSERFNEFLEKNDLYANFYLHAKFQNYTESFRTQKDSHIRLISFGEIPVNEMLMQCKMLITDYSSVCWDVFYQKKPIIFYQFDLDKYEEAQGSYLDMRNDLYGDRAESLEQLLDSFEEHVRNNFQLKPEYEVLHKEYFKFEDNKHSHHICELIKDYCERKDAEQKDA